jgi:hypothetical protein
MRAVLLSFLIQCFAEAPCEERDPAKGDNMCGCPGEEPCEKEWDEMIMGINEGPCYIDLEGGDCLTLPHILILGVLFTCCAGIFVVPGLVCYCKHGGAKEQQDADTPVNPEELKGKWLGCFWCFPACWKYEPSDDGPDTLLSTGYWCLCCWLPICLTTLRVHRDGPRTFSGQVMVAHGRGDHEGSTDHDGRGGGSTHTAKITFPTTKFSIHSEKDTPLGMFWKMV